MLKLGTTELTEASRKIGTEEFDMLYTIRVIFLLFCILLPVLSMMIVTVSSSKRAQRAAFWFRRSTQQLQATMASSPEHHHEYTSRNFVPRYTGPTTLTDEQTAIRDEIVSTRPRTGLSGPFGPWLAVPKIAQPAQQLGRACRYETSLSFRESELVILLTGAYTKSHAEFDIHVGEALKAGWSMAVIQSIPRDDDFSVEAVETQLIPLLVDDNVPMDRDRALARFTAELLVTKTVSDATYQATKAALGKDDAVLVEVTSIVGYYTYVAFTLNVFQIPSPKDD